MPNVLLEAMACGKPFIASSVGGITEIARKNIDCLVTSGDDLELANRIVDVLAKPRLSVQPRGLPKLGRVEPTFG